MMGRMFFIVLAIGIISFALAPNVFAAKFKIPKEACYTLSSLDDPLDGQTLILAFKSSGMKVKIGSGIKKFYSIQGAISNPGGYWNLSGSGYVIDNIGDVGDRFDGDFSSKLEEEVLHCSYFLHSEFGPSIFCLSSIDGFIGRGYDLNEIDCRDIEAIN